MKGQNHFPWSSGETGGGQIATGAGFSLRTSVFTGPWSIIMPHMYDRPNKSAWYLSFVFYVVL
jgi:hypothetical protein